MFELTIIGHFKHAAKREKGYRAINYGITLYIIPNSTPLKIV